MIGIIIVNYNTFEDTLKCVESIINTTKNNFNIYIIDNLSTDNSFNRLKKIYSDDRRIKVIDSKKNGGYSYGNNIGIKMALDDGADSVILSNSDVIYYDGSIDIMYEKYMKKERNIEIIGPKIILEDGSIQDFVRENYTIKNYLFSKKPLMYLDFFGINKKTYNRSYDYKEEYIFSGILSGCCLLIGKRYFEVNGFLDENIFLYFEESLIGINAFNSNMKTCLVPNAVVMHKVSLSIGKKNSSFSRYHRSYSSLYMFKKYKLVNKFKFYFLFLLNIIPFTILGMFDKNYSEYAKKLRVEVKKMKHGCELNEDR